MIKIGKSNDIEVICLLTNMDIPLGSNVGNALEIKEVVDILNNKGDEQLREIYSLISDYIMNR